MCMLRLVARSLLTVLLLTAGGLRANAVEYAFSTYGLGESAFSAGMTPPPGIYVSTAIGVIDAKIGSTVEFGGIVINAGVKADIVSTALNLLYVPDRKFFGGNLGLSITIPAGALAVSDPVDLNVPELSDLAISIFVPGSTGPAAWHFEGRQTSFISPSGDFTASAVMPISGTTQARAVFSITA